MRTNNVFLCMLMLVAQASSFSPVNVNKPFNKKISSQNMLPSSNDSPNTRSQFLQKCSEFLVASSLVPMVANAEDKEAVKGTKADPKFQACLSNCMYECTKPKVEGQKSRAECLPECKKTCATTKEQLMKGVPKA